jgi:hypothetical protein
MSLDANKFREDSGGLVSTARVVDRRASFAGGLLLTWAMELRLSR